jgi:hypothetical protein
MANDILTEKELSNSAYSHIIHAPIEKVDIAGWLFTLPEAEYCRCCPPDHISCAATTTDDGRKMSINVEMIGKTLMVQHFVAETATNFALPYGLDLGRIYAKWSHAGTGDLDS